MQAVRRIRVMSGHAKRVSDASWSLNLLSTAGQDCVILNRDICAPEDRVATLRGHQGEVCGLKVNPVLC